MASNYGPPPVRGHEHQRLSVFVGTWHAEGVSYGEGQDPRQPRAHGLPWKSDETTVWHPGGFFLVQHEHAQAGSGALVTHAVIGYDAAAGEYFAHAVENHGHYRRYIVRVDERVWTFIAELERARIEFSGDFLTQSVMWEWRPFGNEWLPLCDRTNVRVR
ncbi:MAG: DUF1579 family protein [Vicinamibacteraceae bacterium]